MMVKIFALGGIKQAPQNFAHIPHLSGRKRQAQRAHFPPFFGVVFQKIFQIRGIEAVKCAAVQKIPQKTRENSKCRSRTLRRAHWARESKKRCARNE
jgi:hypothetical protein